MEVLSALRPGFYPFMKKKLPTWLCLISRCALVLVGVSISLPTDTAVDTPSATTRARSRKYHVAYNRNHWTQKTKGKGEPSSCRTRAWIKLPPGKASKEAPQRGPPSSPAGIHRPAHLRPGSPGAGAGPELSSARAPQSHKPSRIAMSQPDTSLYRAPRTKYPQTHTPTQE